MFIARFPQQNFALRQERHVATNIPLLTERLISFNCKL
jgi:hypothetical protein